MRVVKTAETSHGFVSSRGESQDAQTLYARVVQALRDMRWSGRKVALSDLRTLLAEANCVDWDGDDSQPIGADVYRSARRFLEALPAAFPDPEVSAGPDGEVSFDWFPCPGQMFTVLILPGGKVIYSSVGPDQRLSGSEDLGETVPDRVLSELRRLY